MATVKDKKKELNRQDLKSAQKLATDAWNKDVLVDKKWNITADVDWNRVAVDPNNVKVDKSIVWEKLDTEQTVFEWDKPVEPEKPVEFTEEAPQTEAPVDFVDTGKPVFEKPVEEQPTPEEKPQPEEPVVGEVSQTSPKEEVVEQPREKTQAEINAEATWIPFSMEWWVPLFTPTTKEEALRVLQFGGKITDSWVSATAKYALDQTSIVLGQSPSTIAWSIVDWNVWQPVLDLLRQANPELYAQAMALYEEQIKTISIEETSSMNYELAKLFEAWEKPKPKEKESTKILAEIQSLIDSDDWKWVRDEIYKNNKDLQRAKNELIKAENDVDRIDREIITAFKQLKTANPSVWNAVLMNMNQRMNENLTKERFDAILRARSARANYEYYKWESDAEFEMYESKRKEAIDWALKKYDITRSDEVRFEDILREDELFMRNLKVLDLQYKRDIARKDEVSARDRKNKIADTLYEQWLNHYFWLGRSDIEQSNQLGLLREKLKYDKEFERYKKSLEWSTSWGVYDSIYWGLSWSDMWSALSSFEQLGLSDYEEWEIVWDMGALIGYGSKTKDWKDVWKWGADIDWANDFTTPAYTPLGGEVFLANDTDKNNWWFGYQVKIRTDDWGQIWLSHLDSISPEIKRQLEENWKAYVKAWEAVGIIWNTWNVLDIKSNTPTAEELRDWVGTHLDFTMLDAEWNYVDPRIATRAYKMLKYWNAASQNLWSVYRDIRDFIDSQPLTQNQYERSVSVLDNNIKSARTDSIRRQVEWLVKDELGAVINNTIEEAKMDVTVWDSFWEKIQGFINTYGEDQLGLLETAFDEFWRKKFKTTYRGKRDLANLAVALNNELDLFARKRTGAVIAASEQKLFEEIIPTVKDQPELLFAKIDALKYAASIRSETFIRNSIQDRIWENATSFLYGNRVEWQDFWQTIPVIYDNFNDPIPVKVVDWLEYYWDNKEVREAIKNEYLVWTSKEEIYTWLYNNNYYPQDYEDIVESLFWPQPTQEKKNRGIFVPPTIESQFF